MSGVKDMPGMFTVNRPEIQLLLSCARTTLDSCGAERIRGLLREEIDWTYLLSTADRHRVVPLLYRSLNATNPEVVPAEVMGRLRERFFANGQRNLLMTGKMFEILDALEERKIPAIPYKGPVLATAVYGNLALREFGDLDFLLDDKDVMKAKDVLTSLGYEQWDPLSRAQEAAFLRYERQYEFARDDGTLVELQWKVTPRYFPFSLGYEQVRKHTSSISLGGRTIENFSPEDLLLTLCVHGPVHSWSRLGWICDVAELVRASGEMDWERLIERADASNSKRMLLLGLFLASQLLGVELEATVLRQARADKVIEALADEVREMLLSDSSPEQEGILEGVVFRRFQFRVIERPRYKLRYCVHRAATPSLREWRALPLPAALFPFYRVLRPTLLMWKLALRLAKRPFE